MARRRLICAATVIYKAERCIHLDAIAFDWIVIFFVVSTQRAMPRLCGAGVIPFSVNEHGDVLFLLAKERYVANWRGSSRWSGFEGGAKSGEGVVENAVREFYEESISAFDDGGTACLSEQFENGDYAMRVNVITGQLCQSHSTQTLHVTFVKQFPYLPALPGIFNTKRNELIALQQCSETLNKLKRELPEPKYPFLREGSLLSIAGMHYVVCDIVNVSLSQSHRSVMTITLKLRASCVPETAECATSVRLHRITMHVAGMLAISAHTYTSWFNTRRNTEDLLTNTSAPPDSMVIQRTTSGRLDKLYILPEFLEKSCVRYWSYEELKTLMYKQRPFIDEFRPYFIRVLRLVLTRFTNGNDVYSKSDPLTGITT